MTWLMALIPVLAIASFMGLWCAITGGLSLAAGWPRLRKLYSLAPPFEGQTALITGTLGGIRYRSVLIAGADSRGLYLNVVVFFRLGAGPILIPWSDIRVSEPTGSVIPTATFEFPEAQTRLHVPERFAAQLLDARNSA